MINDSKIRKKILSHYYEHRFEQPDLNIKQGEEDPVFSQIAKQSGVELSKIQKCANDLLYSKLLSLPGMCGNNMQNVETLPPLGDQQIPSSLYIITQEGCKEFESISYRCKLKRSAYYICDKIVVVLFVAVVAGIISGIISASFG
ncbi:MAG TPA: hypothetical protein O0X22_04505 [Methanocorpusculum sp.]|nr:hypothetical protein [Methanocorpusculum sp.]